MCLWQCLIAFLRRHQIGWNIFVSGPKRRPDTNNMRRFSYSSSSANFHFSFSPDCQFYVTSKTSPIKPNGHVLLSSVMQLFEHLEQSQDSTMKIVSSTNLVIYLGFKFSTTNPRYFLLSIMTESHHIWNKESELFQRGKALFLCMGDCLYYNKNNFSSSL